MNTLSIKTVREEISAVLFPENALIHLRTLLGAEPFILTDKTLFRLYGNALKEALPTAFVHTMSAGEAHKTPETLLSVLAAMAHAGLKRSSALIAFGGGVVSDLGALAASLYMRGIDCFIVPTSLLSMVDASIGGKSAVDFCGVKNLLGSIRQPRAVLIDASYLKTLPRREIVSGLGEIVKHAALLPSLFEKLCAQRDLFDLDFLSSILPENVAFKAKIVEADPFDRGERAALNLGHTTAHAVELTQSDLSHGASVLCGILYEAELAKKHLCCDAAFLDRLEALCMRILPISPKELDLSEALRHARLDKKNAGDTIACILPTRPGEWARLELPFAQYEEELLAIRSKL